MKFIADFILLFIALPVKINAKSLSGLFLQLSDVHLDPLYRVGSKYENYCRPEPGEDLEQNPDDDSRVNFWVPKPLSECDCSEELFNFAMTEVGKRKYDFILYTGDSAKHTHKSKFNVKTDYGNENILVAKKIYSTFKYVPLVYTVGNNDMPNSNQMREGDASLQVLAEAWSFAIPKDEKERFETFGYYYKFVIKEELVVVSLNTNFFTKMNDYNKSCSENGSFGNNQMKWLEQKLNEFAAKGYKVIIIGHHPPNTMYWKTSCISTYINIISKHSDIITAHIYAHMHFDNFYFLYKHEGLQSDDNLISSRLDTDGFTSFDDASLSVETLNNPDSFSLKDDRLKAFKDEIISPAHRRYILKVLKQYKILSDHIKDHNLAENEFSIVFVGPSISATFHSAYKIFQYNVDRNFSNKDNKKLGPMDTPNRFTIQSIETWFYWTSKDKHVKHFCKYYNTTDEPFNLKDLTVSSLLSFTNRIISEEIVPDKFFRYPKNCLLKQEEEGVKIKNPNLLKYYLQVMFMGLRV